MNKYIMMFVAAIALVSCSDDLIDSNTPSTPVEAGAEVKFGLSLEGTRTIYGSEQTTDGKTVFPIYWVDGDKVQILSPDCLEKRDNAEYKVSVANDNQAYADNLTITGANGVQWGSEDKAIFYSIYPSGNYVFDEGKVQINGLKIDDSQTIKVNATDKKIGDADMKNCLMYAVNDGGEANEYKGVPKSDNPVDLQYNPISTVIYVTLKVAANEDATADNYTIQNVRLIAPANTSISGSFSWDCESKSVVADSFVGGSNVVVSEIVDGNNFHTLTNNESISFPIFIAPVRGLTVNKDWKIQVVVAGGATYTKSLDIDRTLTPGQIHKITLPELKPSTTEWQVSNWMVNIPRNVYLSEISIPGTWNSLNDDFNGSNNTIDVQYDLGVRAYHFDTRWASTEASGHSWTDPFYLLSELNSSNMYLSVADGNDGEDVRERAGLGSIGASESLGQVMRQNNTSFADRLELITNKAAANKEEYMVLFCTFANGSFNDPTVSGKTWMQAISDVCASNDDVFDGSKLTANTVLGEALGKVIVIVNIDSDVSATALPKNSKCLFTNIPMNLPANYYTSTAADAHKDDIWYNSTNETGATGTGITLFNSHAQISSNSTDSDYDKGGRGWAYRLSYRDAVVKNIWDWAKTNYSTDNYKHDHWMYLGLGGYQMNSSSDSAVSGSYANIENHFAPMVYDRIQEMKTTKNYYPLGIILMNNIKNSDYTKTDGSTTTDLTYDFSDVCEAVLKMNNEYRLQRDENRPTTTPGYALQQADYDGSLTNGGNAIQ